MEEEARRKIFHLSQFIEEDLQRCLADALAQAEARRLRETSQLERLAQETAIEVGQVLLKAKKEFDPNQSQIEPEIGRAVMDKIEACDAAFSLSFILNQLRMATGVALVEEVRAQVMKQLGASRGKDPVEVTGQLRSLLQEAAERAQKELRHPELTLADLNALATQYGDPEKIAPHLQ